MKNFKMMVAQEQIEELTTDQLKKFKELTGIRTNPIKGFMLAGIISLLDELNPDVLISLAFGQGQYKVYLDDGHDDIEKGLGDNAVDALWEALKTML